MYTAKHAMLYHHKVHDGQAYVFFMDARTPGKGYDEFWRRSIEEDEAVYIRGMVSRLYQKGDKIVVMGSDIAVGVQVEIEADMVVLATAVQPQKGADTLAQKLGISYDKYQFYSEAHAKLRPVECATAGIYLAGACQGPKDIPDTVSQASAAAAKVMTLFARDQLEREPIVARVREAGCVGCFYCKKVCALRCGGGEGDSRPPGQPGQGGGLRQPRRLRRLRHLPGHLPVEIEWSWMGIPMNRSWQ